MNIKRIWLIIPATIMPYVALLATAVTFLSADSFVAEYIMVHIFGGNALNLVVAVLSLALISLILSIVCFVCAVCKKWDALSLAKSAMIIKLIQIPAYVCIFVLGVLFFLTIFTYVISLVYVALDCLTLLMTGLLTSAAVINAKRKGTITGKTAFWTILLQFIFCLDVIASVILFIKLRKKLRGTCLEELSF